MYCRNCGSEIAEGSRFCSHCGQPVEAQIQPESSNRDVHNEPAPELNAEEETARRPVFEEIQWNTSDYPDRNVVEKTEDIDFNWNAAPEEIPDTPSRREFSGREFSGYETGYSSQPAPRQEVYRGEDLEREVFGQVQPEKTPEEMSAAERIDKFYTFNRKNEEFQKLINNEYERVKSGNAIEHEMFEADRNAAQRFQSRPEDSSMDAFLAREGVVKPYQPKEFQSDVLQRIEAQEAEREAKRLEEEARLAAIEEARREAEARKRAEEEAQRRAAEEAARLEEIARRQAEEEARAAEEARVRAAEEARLRAEEEARRRVEEEARLRAEAEARVKAAEEARLKAEADLKAAQEAAKIRAQQEARIAAEAEAQFRAEQERKRLEAEEVQKQLEEKRRRIAQEANQAVAQEEVRKVLEQTARMRAEEEAKIKAAVAGLRSGGAQEPQINKEVEEAHQATRNQINEMAKARDAYFSDPVMSAPAAEQHVAAEPKPSIPDVPVTGRNTMLSPSDEIAKTRVINKAAIAAGLNEATRVASAKPEPAPADDDAFFNSLDAAAEEPISGAYAEAPQAGHPEEIHEPQPMDFKEEEPKDELDDLLSQFEAVNDLEEPISESYIEGNDRYDEYDARDTYAEKPGLNDTVLMEQDDALGSAPANDFDNYGNEEAAQYSKQMLAQEQAQAQYNGGFEQNAADDFYGDDFNTEEEEAPLSKKEQKQRAKEQKRLEKERAKEEKASKKKEKRDYIEPDDDDDDDGKKGGKGRVVLKVILVLLILILIVEVVGMGIRFLAPQSKAAEFIDQQINKVIQLITGDDTEYNVIAAQVRVEPMEDKTDLINAQMDRNENNNIKSIVYSADLAYDQETYGHVTDLVLSTPMTEVEWGRDEDNYPVYYDEQVIGTIIAFESKKVELMNNGSEDVFSLIDPDSALYEETAALSGQGMSGSFDRLEIGEIRQAGSNYYVWVREAIGDTITEKVYSMYPEKQFVMKMTSCIVVE